MDQDKFETIMERMVAIMETKEGRDKTTSEESSLKMKAGTIVTIIVCLTALLAGWLGSIQMIQAGHSESIGALKATQEKTDQQYGQIMASIKQLYDMHLQKEVK